MKQLILTLILVTLSAPVCFGEWLKVATSNDGDTFHIDYERIREHDGYVYFWWLIDNRDPDLSGIMSGINYYQADCDLFRFKRLSWNAYKQPMGKGTLQSSGSKPDENWTYPIPDYVAETTLKRGCAYVKLSEENKQRFLQAIKEINKE